MCNQPPVSELCPAARSCIAHVFLLQWTFRRNLKGRGRMLTGRIDLSPGVESHKPAGAPGDVNKAVRRTRTGLPSEDN